MAGSPGTCANSRRAAAAAAAAAGRGAAGAAAEAAVTACNLVFVPHERKAKDGTLRPYPLLLCTAHGCLHAAAPSAAATAGGGAGEPGCIIHGAAGPLRGPCSCFTTAADADPSQQSVAAVSSLYASYLAQEYRSQVLCRLEGTLHRHDTWPHHNPVGGSSAHTSFPRGRGT